MNSYGWITSNTHGSLTVVEFGAGYFQKLKYVSPTVKKRIGIEIWGEYVENAHFHDCIKIKGDVFDFERHVAEEDMDTALFYDALEHIDRDSAFDLIKRVQGKFNKILLMIPEGNHPQKLVQNPYQDHKSTWYKKDVEELGFQEVVLIENYHKEPGKDSGCIFAIWRKK